MDIQFPKQNGRCYNSVNDNDRAIIKKNVYVETYKTWFRFNICGEVTLAVF